MNVGNNDACGRCETRHGGNQHYCRVHGPVSRGCCEPSCDKAEWVLMEKEPEQFVGRAGWLRRDSLPEGARRVPNSWRGEEVYAMPREEKP